MRDRHDRGQTASVQRLTVPAHFPAHPTVPETSGPRTRSIPSRHYLTHTSWKAEGASEGRLKMQWRRPKNKQSGGKENAGMKTQHQQSQGGHAGPENAGPELFTNNICMHVCIFNCSQIG